MNENQKNLDYLNKAIYEINPNATYVASSIDDIEWKDGTTPISKSDIEAKITDIKANGTTRDATSISTTNATAASANGSASSDESCCKQLRLGSAEIC